MAPVGRQAAPGSAEGGLEGRSESAEARALRKLRQRNGSLGGGCSALPGSPLVLGDAVTHWRSVRRAALRRCLPRCCSVAFHSLVSPSLGLPSLWRMALGFAGRP